MADRILPTRTNIIEILVAHKGEGQSAMITALDSLKTDFPDLSDSEFEKIKDDLNSYSEFIEEEN